MGGGRLRLLRRHWSLPLLQLRISGGFHHWDGWLLRASPLIAFFCRGFAWVDGARGRPSWTGALLAICSPRSWKPSHGLDLRPCSPWQQRSRGSLSAPCHDRPPGRNSAGLRPYIFRAMASMKKFIPAPATHGSAGRGLTSGCTAESGASCPAQLAGPGEPYGL